MHSYTSSHRLPPAPSSSPMPQGLHSACLLPLLQNNINKQPLPQLPGGASSLLFTNCPVRPQTAGLLQAATSKRDFQPCLYPFPSCHLGGQALEQLLLRRASLSFDAKTPRRGVLASRLLQLGQPCVGGEEDEGSRSLERCPRLLPHTHPLPSPSRFSGYLDNRGPQLGPRGYHGKHARNPSCAPLTLQDTFLLPLAPFAHLFCISGRRSFWPFTPI